MNDSSEVKLHFLDYWRVVKVRMGLVVLAFLLVLITAGITTYFLPRQFFSKVTMEVKQDNSTAINPFGQTVGRTYDATFVATQFQILQKTEILYPVIERLDLIKELSPPEVRLNAQQIYNKLKRMMQLQEVRNTGLIEIGVYHTKPEVAANIANTIAVIYQEKRVSDLKKNLNRGLEQLQDEVNKQRDTVEKAALDAAKIRLERKINDPDPDNYNAQLGSSDRSMVMGEQKVNEQRTLVSQLKSQLAQIENLTPEDLLPALRALGIDDPVVLNNLPRLQEARTEEARLLNSGLGDNHPKIKSLRAQMAVFNDILSTQLEAIRRSQATKLRLNENTLADLENQLTTSAANQITDKARMGEYIDAKNKYIQTRKVLETAELSLSAERLKSGLDFDPAKIWEKAEPASAPAKPNVPAYMALAAVVGVIIGVGLAFFIEYLDTSVKTLDDVERFLQTTVLAVIQKNVTTLIKASGDTPDAEAYRILRTNIEFNKPRRDANTLTLISGGPGEGKSTTLNNLAYTCAKGGYNVLVVDADLRRPTQHFFFDVDNTVGLTDYLSGKLDLEEVIKTTKIDNLSFIPSGLFPHDSVSILNSQRMTDLIRKLKQQYDLVFFDSPPILGVSDGSVLASEVDMTVMVIQHRRFPRAMLQRVKQAVTNVGGTLIGAVLNNVDAKHDDGYSYYSSYNEYYAPTNEKRKAPGGSTPPVPRATAAKREEY